jgi:hypothetical protein
LHFVNPGLHYTRPDLNIMPPKGAVKNARKRAHDSPTPDSTSGPKKAKPAASSGTTRPTSTTLASPRKGRQNRDGLGTTTDRPAADQTLKVYASADAVKFLRTSKDCSDYDVRCHYFWAQPFMSARDFNPEERKNLFEGTIAAFAYPPAISAQISQGFDDVYYTYQAYFAAKVEAYAQKWLQTPAGSSWITAREEAK